MKLTDENLDELFAEDEIVRVKHGNITLALSRDVLETALDCLGEKSRAWDWEVIK